MNTTPVKSLWVHTLSAAVLALTVQAQAVSAEEEQMSANVTGDELVHGWHYELTVYGWAKSVNGTTRGSDIDLDFKDDILDMLDGAFMTSFEAEHGRWLAFAAYEYTKIGVDRKDLSGTVRIPVPGVPFPVPVTITGNAEATDTQHLYEIGGGYQVLDGDNFDVTLHGGARYFDYEVLLRVDPITVTLPGDIERSISRQKIPTGDTWWQPFVGARFASQLSDNWRLRGRADYGYSSAGDSNELWMAELIVDWRFNDWGAVEFGYRYADIDYDNGSSSGNFTWDMVEEGPRIGVIFHL